MNQKKRQRESFSVASTTGGALSSRGSGRLASRQMKRRSLLISLGIIACALAVSFAPLPGLSRSIVIVSGSELEEPLRVLQPRFEQQYPDIKLDLRFQGSQDIVNNYVNDDNDFAPTVLIPANGELLDEVRDRWAAQNNGDPFYEEPRPIARTMLVGIAWAERGDVLFPSGQFDWGRLRAALDAGTWEAIGGASEWGSFDFVMTDPERSNSGQVSLALMAQAEVGNLSGNSLGTPEVQELAGLLKRSVYNPPRSTDILLQEFIARGPNDADVATVYESIALHRWEEAQARQGQAYQIYYLDPTVETVSTAAIAQRNIDRGTAEAARQFLNFLTAPEQQAVFVQHGFRPVATGLDVATVPGSPWSQNIPGAEVNPTGQTQTAPDAQLVSELIRLWQRSL